MPDPIGRGDWPRFVLTPRGRAALGRAAKAGPVPDDGAGARYELTAAGRAALAASAPSGA